jgi:hypothetical protein
MEYGNVENPEALWILVSMTCIFSFSSRKSATPNGFGVAVGMGVGIDVCIGVGVLIILSDLIN